MAWNKQQHRRQERKKDRKRTAGARQRHEGELEDVAVLGSREESQGDNVKEQPTKPRPGQPTPSLLVLLLLLLL